MVDAVELFYSINYPSFAAPLASAKDLLVYTATGSKEASDIYEWGSPACSYCTVTNFVRKSKSDVLHVPDTEQRYGKRRGLLNLQ